MTKRELIKHINRMLDMTRIDAKQARKRYNREDEMYYRGKELALLDMMTLVMDMEDIT